jgi:flagellar biosynthesis protein FliR
VLFAPGLSSSRIPMQIRLLVTLSTVLALSPLLIDAIIHDIARVADHERPLLIIQELVTGLVIGLMGRFFILGLQFAANTIWSTVGLGGIPGVALEDSEAGSPLATLVSSAAVMVILSLGLHIEMLRAVIDSYSVIGILAPIQPEKLLSSLTLVVAETSILAIRLAAPFVAYGIVVNVSLGLANRFTPHISLYHATTGLVMLVGMVLLYILWPEWLMFFISSYNEWLQHGGF